MVADVAMDDDHGVCRHARLGYDKGSNAPATRG